MTNDHSHNLEVAIESIRVETKANLLVHAALGSAKEPAADLGRAKAPRSTADPPGPEEVDIRDVLTTPVEALPPALRPVRDLLARCRDDPALFNAEVLGRTLWAKQIEVCAAVAQSPVTIVPAGRAVGKSYLLAGIVLWWLYTRPNSLVITTGPDFRQVATVLWKEIRQALRKTSAAVSCPGLQLKLGYDRLSQGLSSPQQFVVRRGTSWSALGFAAGSEEGFSGHHCGEMLVIVDEASGVEAPIWSSIHGLAASRLVVVGNPLKFDCHFRELHDRAMEGSPSLATVSISSLECPDAGRETSPVGMASKSFLNQMREVHGEDSMWWQANILGQFPGAEAVEFIPAAWLDACTRQGLDCDRQWVEYEGGEPIMGIDIGGGVGADRSVIIVRNRKQILAVFASNEHGVCDDAKYRLEPIVVDMVRRWKVAGGRIVFDQGGLGRSFDSYLAKHGLEDAVGYHGGGKGGKFFCNRRTADAFALRRRLDPFRAGYVPFCCGGIREWPLLREEIAALRAPEHDTQEGRIKQILENKEVLKARLKRSPDLLDALLMSFTFYE